MADIQLQPVAFFTCTQEAYDHLEPKSENALYFTEDTQRIYKGSSEYSRHMASGSELPDPASVPVGSCFVLVEGTGNALYEKTNDSWTLRFKVQSSVEKDDPNPVNSNAVIAYVNKALTEYDKSLLDILG